MNASISKLLTLKYRGTSGMPKSAIDGAVEHLTEYRKRISRIVGVGYDAPEGVINLPLDKGLRDSIISVKATLGDTSKLKHVILIGIGGSALGTEAIYRITVERQSEERTLPTLHVVDSANPRVLAKLEKLFIEEDAPEAFALVIISKSGETAETLVNGESVLSLFGTHFGTESVTRRVVVATNSDSPLFADAEEREWGVVAIPRQVGGRFSIFSGAGLLPLSLCGADIDALTEGANTIRKLCLSEHTTTDPATLSAAFVDFHVRGGMRITDHFFFTPELEQLGMWYRQLFAESLGKEKSTRREVVRRGMLPTVSVGSKDLHSVAQLYFGGPQERITTFVTCNDTPEGPTVPEEGNRAFPDLLPEASGKNVLDLTHAIYDGTKAAYKESHMPYIEASLAHLSEASAGAFMMWKMFEVMYLANLWDINAFDQPEVERYKTHTRALFGK